MSKESQPKERPDRLSEVVSFGRAAVLLVVVGAVVGGSASASGPTTAEIPRPASPGTERGATIPLTSSRCPTFSWATIAGARGYELAIWRLASGQSGVDAERAPELRQRLAGNVGSWTPAPGRCLAPGEAYGWAVAAIPEEGQPRWSDAALFRVAPPPSAGELQAALEVVERHLAAVGPSAAAVADTPTTHPERGRRRQLEPEPTPATRATPAPRDVFGLTAAMALNGDLHLDASDTPRLRLEQNNSLGFTPQVWDIVANEGSLAVLNFSSGVVPFQINAGAPDQALTVSSAGVISGVGSGLSDVDAADLSCSGCVDTTQLANSAVNGPKLRNNTVGAEEIAQVYAIMVECDGDCGNGLLLDLCSPGRAIGVACTRVASGSSTFSCGTGDSMTCSNVAVHGGAQLSRFCDDITGWDAVVYCIPPGLD